MAREYYPIEVGFAGKRTFVAWYTDERDGFVRDEEGRLLGTETLEALRAALQSQEIVLDEVEPVPYNFDPIQDWCADPQADRIDCPVMLNVWNFFDDLTGLHLGIDSPFTRASRAAAHPYNKLFWGNNLPAVTPIGEHYDPIWSVQEIAKIRDVLASGLLALREELAAKVDRI